MKWLSSIFGITNNYLDLEIFHPKLGKLIYEEEGWWKGNVKKDKLDLRIYIDGNETGLDVGLDKICINALNNFSEYNQEAINLLDNSVNKEGVIDSVEFRPIELCWLWEKENNNGFTIRYCENIKTDKIWRVEFENGKTKNVGYDD